MNCCRKKQRPLMPDQQVIVIGAGLAGCEAAWQLAVRGVPVRLVEMKPGHMTPAHSSHNFAELVCSNSLRGDRLENAPGLLKEELRRLGSMLIAVADQTRVPAGGALAVDRNVFSKTITNNICEHPSIEVVHELAEEIPKTPCIVATGPLTEGLLAQQIEKMAGTFHFFDAAAPIITERSINQDVVFRASRWGKGEDYLNCPLDEQQYKAFIEALTGAECAPVHEFEEGRLFEGCMPIESIAKRGYMAAAFGPMRPVGLPNPKTGKDAFAVVQLRKDDAAGELYNLVGFQTRLKFAEQKRVFRLIPGLENAEFMRFGVMHRNSFINSPGFLDKNYGALENPFLFFAGQITGVEGYVESIASGLLAGVTMAARIKGMEELNIPETTAIGALGKYVSATNRHFQPMNINFGLLPPLSERVKGKQKRYLKLAQRALSDLDETMCSRRDLF